MERTVSKQAYGSTIGCAVSPAAGDCVLLPRGHAFRLGSDEGAPVRDALDLFPATRIGSLVTLNGGGACAGVGGYYNFVGPSADLLLGVLPPVVHVHAEADKVALRQSIERLMQELRDPQPGGALLASHLAQVLLIQALRQYVTNLSEKGVGWLFALPDRLMGAALAALHADPGHPWTLQSLAEYANMSRSSFAARFKATVGQAPMEYLARWRMHVAADRLARSQESVATIAYSLGYASESAFGVAFKRVIGCPPRRYAHRQADRKT